MNYYLGIDIGTSSAKLIAVAGDGTVAATCSRDYQYDEPHPGWKEIWPSVWVDAVEDGLSELLSAIDRTKVKAIGFTGQMHTTVFLDAEGSCIRPAIMWNDMRTKESVNTVKDAISTFDDTNSIQKILSTGSPAMALLWLKDNEPENFQRMRKFLIGPDYLVYYFSGVYGTDYCEASTSSLYDNAKQEWSASMRNYLGLDSSVYPTVRGCQINAGYLKKELQEKLGLPSDTAIITGTGDNCAAAVATGGFSGHYPVLSIGTSGVLVLSRSCMQKTGKGKQILFSLDGETIYLMVQGVVQSAGGSYHWFGRKILGERDFDRLTEKINPETIIPSELLFYPHLTGDKTIFGDPSLRGTFIGLDTNTSREDMAVAVMEGVGFAIRQLIEEMKLTKEELEQLKVTGGGSHSRLWMQLLADILNVGIGQLDGDEGASYGIAVIARNSVEPEIRQKRVNLRENFIPRKNLTDKYSEKYQRYLKIYDALQLINQR